MSQPRVYRTEAVVLKGSDFGETDKVLTLYTLHHGKIRVVAKGVRRPGSRLGGHLDLLTRSQLMLAHGRNLDILPQGGDYALAGRVRKDDALRGEVEAVLRDQIRYLLERDLKASAFLTRLRAMIPSARVPDQTSLTDRPPSV